MSDLISRSELWKSIIGYEDYQISNFGRVRNKRGKILKPFKKGKYGHSMVGLSKNNKSKKFQIHRLVAIHFVPNPENKPEVCHVDNSLDENGFLDNSANNLIWGTHKENCEFENTRKKQSENHADFKGINNPNYGNSLSKELKDKMTIDRGIQVLQVSNKRIVGIYNSLREAGRKTGITWQNIKNVCDKKYKHAGGYEWFYFDYLKLSYNIDKIVKELERHKDTTDLTTVDEEMVVGFTIYQGAFNDAIDKAIEIVKAGRKDE